MKYTQLEIEDALMAWYLDCKELCDKYPECIPENGYTSATDKLLEMAKNVYEREHFMKLMEDT